MKCGIFASAFGSNGLSERAKATLEVLSLERRDNFMLLSLYSGCGGLDLGFEQVGFQTGLAYDIRAHSINSWNRNRPDNPVGHVADIRSLTLAQLDNDFGARFCPTGVIGGPPCQSFTNANSHKKADD
ncbi:MAG: hypothetical protein C0511_06910, partial [Hyphomicrobium sp.]|nr:hypothetical protein [Hyphomicrobium sp.]